jgi:hypothetical protein
MVPMYAFACSAGGAQAVHAAEEALDAARGAIDDTAPTYQAASSKMKMQVQRVSQVAERVRANSRKMERSRWVTISVLLSKISEPASSLLRLEHDDLDAAIHEAQEKIGALQAQLTSGEPDFKAAEKNANRSVGGCVSLFRRLGGDDQ